jgi:predicted acyltransferase
LDVFRGGTIAAMILVNNQASPQAYHQLRHAEWHGWTFTDLVFPFFLWIVGVAITLSFAKRVERGDDRSKLLFHVFRRSLMIFSIGLLLNAIPRFDLGGVRIPGVLQRIAICYFLASAVFLYFETKGRILWALFLFTSYWIAMKLLPVPGFGAGDMSVDGNFAKYIDGIILTGHMYSATKTWDPEGIVSTLPAVVNTLLGIFCGQMLQWKRSMEEKTAWLFFAGNTLVFGALMLSTWMPINKKLWTVPYALFTSGLAFVVFACCYWLVDVKGWTRFAKPFSIYGMNALAVYILSGLVGRVMDMIPVAVAGGAPSSLRAALWKGAQNLLSNPADASLLFGSAHVLLLFAFAFWMYRRNIILRV